MADKSIELLDLTKSKLDNSIYPLRVTLIGFLAYYTLLPEV